MGLLLTVTSAVGAAPTIDSRANLTGVCAALPNLDRQIPVVASVTDFVDCGDTAFVAVADAFLKPNLALAVPELSPDRHSADLPAVPPAMLMVILGSLCVILVRDRAMWLAAFSGLMWFGLTGIQLFPVPFLSQANLWQPSAQRDHQPSRDAELRRNLNRVKKFENSHSSLWRDILAIADFVFRKLVEVFLDQMNI